MSSKTAPQIAPGKGPQSNHGIARGREPQFSRGSADYSLQQTLGNQATCQLFKSGMIQAKLRVSQPGDPDELEADRVADQVVSAGRSGVTSQRPFLPIFPSSASALHRKCACLGSAMKCATCEEEEVEGGKGIHRKTSSSPSVESAPSSLGRSLGGGKPLDTVTRKSMDSAFGRDFSNVRIHTGSEAASAAQSINARAFTIGNDVIFNSGEYSPFSHPGQTLIAHELAHTVQQTSTSPTIHRAPTTAADKSSGAASFIQDGWSDLDELGIVYRDGTKGQGGGANIYESPNGPLLDWLPQNTRVYIIRQDNKPKGWYAVASAGGTSQFGYVAKTDIWRNLPDPESEVVKIKSGDTALGLARRHYKNKGFDVSGKDKRYIVNALVWVNSHAKHNAGVQPGIFKAEWRVGSVKVAEKNDDRSPWETTQLTAGVYIWLPGPAYLNAIYEEVAEQGGGTGSIKEDLWRTAKHVLHYVEYGLAFIGGLIHGFFKSLWDAVAGLATMLYDILKSILTGSVISDVRELASKVGSLKWKDIKDAIGEWADEWAEKLDSDSPWTAGHAHGYLTGYIMAEAAMLLLTGGAIESIKGAVWGSRLGKLVQETAAFKKLATGVKEVGELGGKAREAVAKAAEVINKTKLGKVAVGTAKVIQWTAKRIMKVLELPSEVAQFLTDKIVQSFKRLEPQFERIKKLSQTAKRWLLGCHSPCEIDIEAMASRLKLPDKIIEQQAERELGAAASKSAASPATKASSAKAAPKPPAVEPPKIPAPKVEPPMVETPKAQAPKTEAPKTEVPKVGAPRTETPKSETAKPKSPAAEKPLQETPKTEAPRPESPKTETAKQEPTETKHREAAEGKTAEPKSPEEPAEPEGKSPEKPGSKSPKDEKQKQKSKKSPKEDPQAGVKQRLDGLKKARAQMRRENARLQRQQAETSARLKEMKGAWEAGGPEERAKIGPKSRAARKKFDELSEKLQDLSKEMKANQAEQNKMIEALKAGTYDRPSFRKETEDAVWKAAQKASADGVVRDPAPPFKEIKLGDPWQMGHKPGYEFRKHQQSAAERGISRERFVEEYNDPNIYRPETPETNASHKLEAPDHVYYGK